jgi:hypothetical protein
MGWECKSEREMDDPGKRAHEWQVRDIKAVWVGGPVGAGGGADSSCRAGRRFWCSAAESGCHLALVAVMCAPPVEAEVRGCGSWWPSVVRMLTTGSVPEEGSP